MATNYPTSLDSYSSVRDRVNRYQASQVNDLQDAVVAIQTELGTDPAGNSTNVKTRITSGEFAKGADIASASPLVLGTDGTYFDVTGTTGFSAITVAAGRFFILQFDGALILTHGASLDLPGAANITTAAGDHAVCFATAANTVAVLDFVRGDGTITIATAAPATPLAKTLYEDSIVKAWLDQGGTTTPNISDDVNVSSITDTGVGDRTVNLATNMANATYAVLLTGNFLGTAAAPGVYATYNNGSRAVGSYEYYLQTVDSISNPTETDQIASSLIIGNN